MEADDAELIRRYARDSSEEAFAELVRRYLALVYHAALRQVGGDAPAAEDVTQHVFTLLARKASSLGGHRTLAGWLHTTTRFAASQVMRTERRRRAREQEAHLMHELLSNDPAASADWERLRPVIDETLGELNERDREAVLLRFFAGLPLAEVGEKLNLTENAARMRVERALEKLHGALMRRGVTSVSGALAAVLANQPAVAVPAGLVASVTGAALMSAAGTTAVGPVAGLIQFMSTLKITSGVAVLLLTAVLGGAIREVYARGETEKVVASLTAENDALAKRLAGLERRTNVASAMPDQSGAAEKKLPAISAGAATDAEAYLAQHPELRALINENTRALNAGRYALFTRARGLSPAQVERFLDLVIPAIGSGYRLTNADGTATMYLLPGDRGSARRELRALLGEEGFREWMELGTIGPPVTQTAARLAAALYRTPTPLTAEQADQLYCILRDRRVQEGSSPQRFDWEAIVRDATGVLSAPQLVELGYLRVQDETGEMIQRARDAARTAAGK